MPKTTHKIEPWTVIAVDQDGEEHDLNSGEPCADHEDLIAFIEELHAQGAFDRATADALIDDAKIEAASLIAEARRAKRQRLDEIYLRTGYPQV